MKKYYKPALEIIEPIGEVLSGSGFTGEEIGTEWTWGGKL